MQAAQLAVTAMLLAVCVACVQLGRKNLSALHHTRSSLAAPGDAAGQGLIQPKLACWQASPVMAV